VSSKANANALRRYTDPREEIATVSAQIIQHYRGSRRVRVIPKGTGADGFSVSVDGTAVCSIDSTYLDASRIRERIDTALCKRN